MATHIAVIGDAFMDVVCGPLERLPTWGGDVEAPSIQQLAGGSALNVAVGIGSLVREEQAAKCSFHALVGEDDFAAVLRRKLGQCNVVDCLAVDSGVGTGCCIVLSGHEDRGFVTTVGATGKLDVSHLHSVKSLASSKDGSHLRRFHLHVSGFYSCTALRPNLAQFLRDIRAELSPQLDFTISFDTNSDSTEQWDAGVREVLKEVDIFLPNEVEARGISKVEDLEEAANVLASLVRQGVVLTCGGDGAILQRSDDAKAGKPPTRMGICPNINPVDFTGAGDAFDYGFIYRWVVCGGSLEDGVVSGSCCGGLCTQTIGANTAPPSADTLRQMERTARDHILGTPGSRGA